jgi:hypothetical protein
LPVQRVHPPLPRNSVVIQNIELEELAEADTERITTLVYTVVSSNEFRQRCLALQVFFPFKPNPNCQNSQERNKQRQQAADSTTSNHNLSPSKSHPPAASISSGGTQEFLPARIERLARRRKPADVPTKQKGEEAEGKKDSEGKKNSEEEGKTKEEEGKTKEEEGKKSEKQAVERPPLVRVQFRSKEAGYVFCQLFKVPSSLATCRQLFFTIHCRTASRRSVRRWSRTLLMLLPPTTARGRRGTATPTRTYPT